MNQDANPDITVNPKDNGKLLILVILVTLALGGLNIFQKVNYTKKLGTIAEQYSIQIQKIKNNNDCSQCNSNNIPITSENQNGEFKVYNSDKLGISFSYFANKVDTASAVNEELSIKELDNKIYLYIKHTKSEPDDITKGKYIEVSSKDPNESLTNTIKNKFLTQDTTGNCEIVQYNNKGSVLNPTYEYLYIKIANSQNLTQEEEIRKATSCSHAVTNLSGMGYFIMDKGHPDKFGYVYVGQSPISFPFNNGNNGNNISWEDTISFY